MPNVGPFTIVGMAGFFAGVAKTPISTLLMVGELTGNYALLLPSMLVVCLSMIIAHRWTIYPEQVATRADSPAHRDELLLDVLADLAVGNGRRGASQRPYGHALDARCATSMQIADTTSPANDPGRRCRRSPSGCCRRTSCGPSSPRIPLAVSSSHRIC